MLTFNAKSIWRHETPLHGAARWGNKDIVELIIAKGEDVSARDEDSSTPLHHAFECGGVVLSRHRPGPYPKDVLELLVNKGADINAKNKNSITPLHGAASEGHRNVAEFLIANGANVDSKDSYRITHLHSAVLSWKTIAREGMVGLLVDKGANVNARTASGWTPLHYAAKDGDVYVAKLLVESGADVNTKDSDGKTPLAKVKAMKK